MQFFSQKLLYSFHEILGLYTNRCDNRKVLRNIFYTVHSAVTAVSAELLIFLPALTCGCLLVQKTGSSIDVLKLTVSVVALTWTLDSDDRLGRIFIGKSPPIRSPLFSWDCVAY